MKANPTAFRPPSAARALTAPRPADSSPAGLPLGGELSQLLSLSAARAAGELLSAALIEPLLSFVRRPRKEIRGQLVELGYALAGGKSGVSPEGWRACALAAKAVEFTHAAALVVDDIEDDSSVRRGMPALHLEYGVPIALNGANWLYFWSLHLVQEMRLAPENELQVYRSFHRTLLRAHCGQALDLGVKIDTVPQERVASICAAALRLKTGALTGLALMLGGMLGGASADRAAFFHSLGESIGFCVQMFDDVGNLTRAADPTGSRQYEDLRLRRPSWVWAAAAIMFSPAEYEEFRRVVGQLPETAPLEQWLERRRFVPTVQVYPRRVLSVLVRRVDSLLVGLPSASETRRLMHELKETITHAYL